MKQKFLVVGNVKDIDLSAMSKLFLIAERIGATIVHTTSKHFKPRAKSLEHIAVIAADMSTHSSGSLLSDLDEVMTLHHPKPIKIEPLEYNPMLHAKKIHPKHQKHNKHHKFHN